jgi:hypothetical protein
MEERLFERNLAGLPEHAGLLFRAKGKAAITSH